jgi:hypothetical protein
MTLRIGPNTSSCAIRMVFLTVREDGWLYEIAAEFRIDAAALTAFGAVLSRDVYVLKHFAELRFI